ncbi:MAG TPA: DUF3891 family protein [Pseudogracilibacillus sp.]|nr:DUF3891 family protein [Pseudogracilibacillus sp.]
MIVRENQDSFTMIEQHHHGLLAHDIMKKWEGNQVEDDFFFEALMYAIKNHDKGWRMFDKQPFWNDAKDSPYTFTNFPTLAKTVLYKQGIDEVETENAYAALLCSEHYVRFMNNNEQIEAKQFVNDEKKRQDRIIASLTNFNDDQFLKHYELLKFADNLSLYICLNEPGVSKDREHFFFRDGIPAPKFSSILNEDKIQAHWQGENIIRLSPFPFSDTFQVTYPAKLISREGIEEIGILETYKKANNFNTEVILQEE